MMVQLSDNSDVTEYQANPIIQELLNRDLNELEQENFISLPPIIAASHDLDGKNYIFKSQIGRVWTGNIVGLLKKGGDEIQIQSRFYDHATGSDYFIKYMLQQVLNLNLIRDKVNVDSKASYYDLLPYLFPMYLNMAMQKGLYKEYVKHRYNDANIKGTINVARHIKMNTPFMGKVSYDTREFSYDNKITQLIRHTIEKLKIDYNIEFPVDDGTKENVQSIVQATQTYFRLNRSDIVEKNIFSPVHHGYFSDYYQLQQLCIQILNEDKIGFGREDDEVHGIIIDVAWLWEEYLNKLLKLDFIHSENKNSRSGVRLYSSGGLVYPDFYSKDQKVVLDAKYKELDDGFIRREDRYQIISYLHVLKSDMAGIAYPSKVSGRFDSKYLNGFGGMLFKLSLCIPQQVENYSDFEKLINENERAFIDEINSELK
ncbi:hypothetical protein JK162_03090 [Leuconostoc pseudomesenteroides]|nr:hypothetical protein [Leuconostoc pseudomesenteroides]